MEHHPLSAARRNKPLVSLLWLFLAPLALFCAACGVVAPSEAHLSPTATRNYGPLETQVARKLAATLTAKAPTPTHTVTPVPSETPEPATPTRAASATAEPSAQPSLTPRAPALAYVRVSEDGAANILYRDLDTGEEHVLTHFVDPRNLSDLSWTSDGAWLVFVSSHDHIASRNNERNVFTMRADGTELHMLTGDYLSPEEAPGPYAVLRGQVLDARGTCRVYAQGATGPALADDQGVFEIPGVPLSARWARAICLQDGSLLEGDQALSAKGDVFDPLELAVVPSGQGWRQASLSPDYQIIAGTYYTWTLGIGDGAEDPVLTQFHGVIYDTRTAQLQILAPPEGYSLNGVAWDLQGERLVGAMAGEEGVQLRFWDAQGQPLDLLFEVANPEDQLLSAGHPEWSPDGSMVVFELRRHAWWGDPKYRIDLVVADLASEGLNTLVESEWGADASHPGWSPDGSTVIYQVSRGDPGEDHSSRTNGDVWQVSLQAPQPSALTRDGASYLPALRP